MEPRNSPYKNTGGLGRLFGATRYALAGLRSAWANEAAFRLEVMLFALLVPLALLAPVSPLHRLLLIGSWLLVLMTELINSAIEAVVDRVGIERHDLSKRAKDLGSAAVLLSLVLATCTWTTLLWPVLSGWLSGWLSG